MIKQVTMFSLFPCRQISKDSIHVVDRFWTRFPPQLRLKRAPIGAGCGEGPPPPKTTTATTAGAAFD